ncbi:bifunctional diaminohydroxyphosphoribosylaminopyrimidine deaminase/5-amino-6-(5-phosphoribosylamino)uracil reductase RibD [Patescibacteria group bacterium]|nr:bifunctional diaminohydroxyphosphoribosylaminopyrimidine deaminase/5-amino-6-(5-phosphoribosylamino)uracil reductase RibD [Patescibacteria group bacterium]
MSVKFTQQDKQFMRRALMLARRGEGQVSPNPLVGAVLVRNGGIIGEGYHQRYGGAHAEVNTIKNAVRRGYHAKIPGSTLYVTLEPCCHQGQTSPCVDEIIKRGISRVVVALAKDPNPLVSGRGISKLRRQGIKVETGLMKKEASELKYPFIKFMQTGLPFVILKVGMSLDGRITHPRQKYITNKKSLTLVHQIRNNVDGILVGINTVIKDNPRLNVRLRKGRAKKITPIILDPNLRVSSRAKAIRPGTIIVTKIGLKSLRISQLEKRGVKILPAKISRGKFVLKDLLKELGKLNITSILVEGGQEVITSFLNARLVDKVHVFISPELFGAGQLSITGELAKIVKLDDIKVKKLENNILVTGYAK